MPVVGSRSFTKLVIDELLMLAGALPDAEVHALTAGLARAQGHRVVAASRPQHHKLCMLISELNQATHFQLCQPLLEASARFWLPVHLHPHAHFRSSKSPFASSDNRSCELLPGFGSLSTYGLTCLIEIMPIWVLTKQLYP